MRFALISLSLLLASGGALAQLDAMKSPAPKPGTDAARPPAVMPAKPLTPRGPLAAPAALTPSGPATTAIVRRPSVATGDNDDTADLDVPRRKLNGVGAPGAPQRSLAPQPSAGTPAALARPGAEPKPTGAQPAVPGAPASAGRQAPAPWCEDDCRAMKASPASAARSKPQARGGGDGGPGGQTEDEVYIGARSKARPMKQ